MRGLLVFAGCCVAAMVAACSSAVQAPAPLAPVAAVTTPMLPSWIASISPTTTAQSLAQIRVIFAKPVTTVSALESASTRDLLAHLRIAPALKGAFVVLTPRMIGFVPEQALPVGTRVRVTLTSGLRDVEGDTLGSDLTWTFQTQPLAFTGLPGMPNPDDSSTPAPLGVRPTLSITANARVVAASLSSLATLRAGDETVPLQATLEAQPTPYPGSGAQAAFNPQLTQWVYDLTPTRDLRKDTAYQLVVAAGVAPAYGNLPTAKQFVGTIRTYGPLRIIPTPQPSSGAIGNRFAGGDPTVTFDNPLDPKSLAGNVTLSPAPKSTASLTRINDYYRNVLYVNPYLLDPDSTYTLTIGADVKDVFGQTLGSPRTITLRTGPFAPGFWAPNGDNVFPSSESVALNIYGTNVPGNRYQIVTRSITPDVLANTSDPREDVPVPPWPSTTFPHARRNVQSIVRIPIARGVTAYGISADLGANNQFAAWGSVQLTDLGVFAQIFPEHAIVMVQSLSDGAPVAGATVTLYRTGTSASSTPCARGTTSVDGTYTAGGAALQSCYAGTRSPYDAPSVLAVASLGADWAYARVDPYSGIYQFNVYAGWPNGAPTSYGTIFSDRQMYQPGEHARVTGVAYSLRGGDVVADKNERYAVTLVNPDNATTSLGTVRTDAFGVFSLDVPFVATQKLGYYTINAKGPSGDVVSGQVRVAEFKPPNFKLDLALDKNAAVAGTQVEATAKGAYLFGAPLDGGTAKISVTRGVAALAPKGWDDYAFGRQWFWPEQQPSFDSDVLQAGGAFDRTGTFTHAIAVPADLPFPMTYTVDVDASDVSNATVSNTQTFTALPADAIVGLKTDFVGQAGKPLNVSAVVTNVGGTAVAGRSVHVELQKMTYTSVTQVEEGGENAQNAVQYTTVESTDVTPGSQPATLAFHPKDTGPYRVRANFAGAKSDASETDVEVFVVGEGETNWGAADTGVVQIQLDKKSYKIGDTATALVASPFPRSDVYLAVIRNDVIEKTLVHAVGNGPKISFRITPAMLPNAAVEALVVRRGPQLKTLAPGSLDSLARIGVVPLKIDLSDRYLKVRIDPAHATLQPGARQSVSLHVRDASGKAIAGEIAVMVVNDAVLQLTGYRPPDLVQTIFADQPIATRFADNRRQVVLKTRSAPAEKGWGYGGGFLAGAGSTRVRTEFRPLAYYAVRTTDPNGDLNVAFTLPDDLTTWRVMAVAIADDDRHFGQADATFVATKPLITNALLPTFARPGDRIDAGITALNQTGVGGALQLVAQVSAGGALRFASGDPLHAQISETLGTGLQALRFPMVVGTPAPTTVTFSSALGAARDAFRVPFEVRDRAVTETVVESGTTSSHASIPLDLSHGGTLAVTLSNSAVPQFAVPASNAMQAEAQPFLDDASARLIVASALRGQAPRYHLAPRFDVATAITAATGDLAMLQRSDGGYGMYQGAAQSDPFASAYAATALAFARDHGAIQRSSLAPLKAYLARTLENPARYTWCKEEPCRARARFEMLWALDALGDRRTDFLSDIVAQRDAFDSATQIRLARYLLRIPAWHAQGRAIADHLMQRLYLTGRYATANDGQRWGWLGSTVDAQAQMLQLLVERKASPQTLDGAVRALAAQQCKCGWPTLRDTAEAMQAIAAYATTEHLTPSSATANLGGSTLGTARFGSTASSDRFASPATSARALDIAAHGGTVHYVVTYTYPVPADAPGVLAGLRAIRDVTPAGETTAVATMDLAALRDPIALAAGRVFDIGVRVIADHPVDGVVIEDPLPAGMEAIDATFQTSSTAVIAKTDSWAIDEQRIYNDRVVAYASHLEPGVYEMHYLARTVTPGTYRWPGARVYLRAAPEEFGRTAAAVLDVK